MKTCTKCKEVKPYTEFNKGNDPNGLFYWCKGCMRENARKNYAKPKPSPPGGKLTCRKCDKTMTTEHFPKNGITKYGYSYTCKACTSEQRRQREIRKGKPPSARPWNLILGMRRCHVCKQILAVNQFHPRGTKGGKIQRPRTVCKQCHKIHNRELRAQRKEERGPILCSSDGCSNTVKHSMYPCEDCYLKRLVEAGVEDPKYITESNVTSSRMIAFTCPECGEYSEKTYGTLMATARCNKCTANRTRLPDEVWDERAAAYNLTWIEHPNSKHTVDLKCLAHCHGCGNDISIRPSNMTAGRKHACKHCSQLDQSWALEPTVVYLLSHEDGGSFKFGITMNWESRSASHALDMYTDVLHISESGFARDTALIIEDEIKKTLRDMGHEPLKGAEYFNFTSDLNVTEVIALVKEIETRQS